MSFLFDKYKVKQKNSNKSFVNKTEILKKKNLKGKYN